jgi:hypothetical protein
MVPTRRLDRQGLLSAIGSYFTKRLIEDYDLFASLPGRSRIVFLIGPVQGGQNAACYLRVQCMGREFDFW